MHSDVSGKFGDITLRLHRWSAGSRDAENELFEVVFPGLRRLAQYLMKAERNGHPLEPGDLVNQIYFRLAAAKKLNWRNRAHFFALAGMAMRQHLIDCARARGGKEFVPFEECAESVLRDSTDLELLIGVGQLLDQLAVTNPDWRLVMELKCFRGLTDRATAAAMGIKLRTMQRMWADVREWLLERADPCSRNPIPRCGDPKLSKKGKLRRIRPIVSSETLPTFTSHDAE
jgi:RNA polymerase sigma-70 factor, ECF subfamily